jgi:hypothetical protein
LNILDENRSNYSIVFKSETNNVKALKLDKYIKQKILPSNELYFIKINPTEQWLYNSDYITFFALLFTIFYMLFFQDICHSKENLGLYNLY